MTQGLPPSRRDVLLGLTAMIPAVAAFGASAQATEGGDFLWISRIVTGNDALSAGVADRIEALLSGRIDGFGDRVSGLAAAMRTAGGDRRAMLGGLDERQVKVALSIAKPWYVGYVGKPSSFILDDDAAFATFLEAQSWEKILPEVPRITYPTEGAGWWSAAPPGVTAPSMPGGIAEWSFVPEGPKEIMAPDPAWRTFATASHPDPETARGSRPPGGVTR